MMKKLLKNRNMKSTLLKVVVSVLALAAISFSGCNGDEPTVQEKTEALLVSAEWNKPVVTVDGVDQSDLYSDFTIKFIKGTYTSAGGGPLWPTTGTWTFKDETASVLILDGNKEVQINEITETALELAVQNDNTTFISGRTQSIKGKNVFKLKKK